MPFLTVVKMLLSYLDMSLNVTVLQLKCRRHSSGCHQSWSQMGLDLDGLECSGLSAELEVPQQMFAGLIWKLGVPFN